MILSAAILGAGDVNAQGYTGWDGARSNQDRGNDYVDCSTGYREDMAAWRCMNQDWFREADPNGTFDNNDWTVVYGKMPTKSGIYGKVAAASAASRPRRSSSSSSSSVKRVLNNGQKVYTGTKSSYFSAESKAWRAQRQAQIQAAREEAAARKREEERQRRIADDNRAAAVEAATNARLQQETNQAIASYQYHATQGARRAQQMARNASTVKGPQFAKHKQQSTSTQQASRLRGANKPRRVMKAQPQVQARNTARPVLKPVKRSAAVHYNDPVYKKRVNAYEAMMAKKELAMRPQPSRILISKEKNKEWNSGKPFLLDEHASSSLGQDWKSDDFKPLPMPPEPVTRVKRKMTAEDYHKLVVIEMIDQRPLTPEESAYYDNLK